MLLLVSVLLALWAPWAQGQVQPCDFPDIPHGTLRNEARYKPYFPVSVGKWYYYSCHSNYVTPSEGSWDYLTCTGDGWSPKVPCLRKCVFNHLENGHSPVSEGIYLQGQSVKVNCSQGYSLENQQTTMTCTEDGWVPPSKCIRVVTCEPPRIANSHFTPDRTKYRAGHTIRYNCKSGYYPSTRGNTAKCTDTGWEPPPRCSFQPCDFPDIPHGYLHHEARYKPYFPVSVGKWYYYSCHSNYVTPSERSWDYLTCTRDGWSPKVPCLRKCVFNHLENGHSPVSEGIYLQGQSLKVNCSQGYSLENQQTTMTCTEDGWVPPSKCIRVEVTCEPPRIANSHFTPDRTKYRVGHTIRYNCKSGYYPSTRGNTAKCTDTGWEPPPRCSFQPCDFPDIPHGYLHHEARYKPYFPVSVGRWYYYSCHSNYVTPSEGSWDYLTCTRDGWSPKVPCLRKCVFNHLENGHSPVSEGIYLQGQSVKVNCSQGYSLENQQTTMTCTEDGWVPPPKCIRVDTSCGSPPAVENAFVPNNRPRYSSGDTVRYACKNSLDLFGNAEVSCLNGNWTDPPQCKESRWKCGPPPTIDNGDITTYPLARYAPGSSVEYQCQSYYELQGNRKIECREGKWSEPPKCLDACVISEDTMKKHHIRLRWSHAKKIYLRTDDYIEFICEYGYRKVSPESAFRALCLEGKVAYPTCA